MTKVSAVVLAWLEEPWLESCVDALLGSEDVDVEVVVIDNGCTDGSVEKLTDRSGLSVVQAGRNLGFAGGCNFGAQQTSGSVLVFVNSDAIVTPRALRELVDATSPADVAIASASVRLADRPDRMNTAGNPIHFLGFSWAGAAEESADRHRTAGSIAAASGSCMAVRRDVWEELEGFCEPFFAYQEDAELSWRAWMSGRKVVFAPKAVALHHYDPSRNPDKRYLIERNRIAFLLTLYEARTLALLTPLLIVTEVGMIAVAAVQGWLPQKLRGFVWLARRRRWLRTRRTQVQRTRRRRDRDLTRLLTAQLEAELAPRALTWVATPLLTAYWWLVRRALDLGRKRTGDDGAPAAETEET